MMFEKLRGILAAFFGLFCVASGTTAFAAAVDVADVVTDIGAQLVPVGLIGSAVLLLIVGIKAYKWVRRAM